MRTGTNEEGERRQIICWVKISGGIQTELEGDR
jgi:hypothetical protein